MDLARGSNAELLADAQSRLSSAADEAAAPKVGGAIQFRFDLNNRDNHPSGNDLTTGFQNRLTTLWVTGSLHEKWVYRVQGNFTQDTGTFVLEDAYFAYASGNGWLYGAGQLYFPVLWEDYVDKWKLLAADYSPTNSVFRPDRVQGAFVNYTGDQSRFWGAFHDGAGTVNSDYDSPAEADYALTARAEYKFAGDWGRFADFTSFQNSDFAAKAGGSAHWQSGGDTVNTADMDIFLITGDVCVEGNGWNAFAAATYRSVEPAVAETLNDWGFVLQGGAFINAGWELFGRYDVTVPDDDARAGTQSAFNAFTIGANHYIVPDSHAIKLTFDVSYFPDAQSESITPASTFTGVLDDAEGGQLNARIQVQLLF